MTDRKAFVDRTKSSVTDLSAKQLRGLGNYAQAALLLDQMALLEDNEETAATARAIAAKLRIFDKRHGEGSLNSSWATP